jgi:hypothetical protein
MPRVVDWLKNLQMPAELQEKWGYPEITEDMRRKFLGLNLARLAKIDTKKRVKRKPAAPSLAAREG